MVDEDLKFSVDSQLLGELGERLVTRNYIALSELIKNAYDADAKNLTIRFISAKKGLEKTGKGEIQLIDDGHGMTFEEIKNFWMRVATPMKLRDPTSLRFGRRKTGNKGIGRFACRRLAKKLTIESTAKISKSKEFEFTKVVFDWGEFKAGTTLTEIPCKYETRKIENGKPGTILKLTALTEHWSDNEFILLRRQVLTLSILGATRRKGFEEDPGFNVKLDAPEFPEGEGDLAEQVMEAGWGTLQGQIMPSGEVHLSLNAKNIGDKQFDLPKEYSQLAGIQYKIAWVPVLTFEKAAKGEDYYRNPKLLTKTKAQKIMIDQGGIRVYLDGFRVYPYGEPRNDWLDIDKDVARRLGGSDRIFKTISSELGITDLSRAMLHHPRSNALVGIINISSEKTPSFEVKLDREGFVENETYTQLIEVIRLSLQWMVLHYNRFLTLKVDASFTEAKDAFTEAKEEFEIKTGQVTLSQKPVTADSRPVVKSAFNVLHLEAKKVSSTLPESAKKESEELFSTALNVIEQSYNQSEMYRNILGAVASTGVMMFVFTHEIKGLIAKLDTHAKTINRLLDKMPKDQREEFEQFSKSLGKTRKRFDQHIKIFGLMAEKTADKHRKEILVKDAASEVAESFDYLIEYYKMNKPVVDVPETLKTRPMLDAEVYSILVNLVSNAVKVNLAGTGKNILIEGLRENNATVIRVYDDGIGLPKEYRETVFQPLSADPQGTLYKGLKEKIPDEDLAALGRGTGLGLSIVKSMIEPYNGKVQFIDTKKPWKTCIEVVIP
jgi:signal transduction histidine kinase